MTAQISNVERPSLAFATHRAVPEISGEDHLAAEAMTERYGMRVEAVPWDAETADWSSYSAVLIRSTWDYHLRPERFFAWAEGVAALGVAVWNPAAVVRWNANKRYLRALEAAGVPIVPTAWVARGTSVVDLRALLDAVGWERVVVKPSISLGSYRTWLADSREVEPDPPLLLALLADADAMVQPFLSRIRTEGEWSFVFFDDGSGGPAFSHAVVKRPVQGDFRVQTQFGGSVTPVDPPPELVERLEYAAEVVWRLAPGPLLYARLDGVISDGAHAPVGTFLLMEAELIEPRLYLDAAPAAPARFTDALAARLGIRQA